LRLQPVATDVISDYLAKLLQNLSIEFEPDAVATIATAASGSIRDSLSILEQAIAYGQNKITCTDIQKMLGLASSELIDQLILAIHSKDTKLICEIIANMQQQGLRFLILLRQLQTALANIALRQFICQHPCSAQQQQLAQQIDAQSLQLYYEIAMQAQHNFQHHPSEKIGFSLTVLRMVAFQQDNSTTTAMPLQQTPVKINHPSNVGIVKTDQAITAELDSSNNATKTNNAALHAAKSEPQPAAKPTNDAWPKLHTGLNLSGAASALAQHLRLDERNNDKWHFSCDSIYSAICNNDNIRAIESAINNNLSLSIKVFINYDSQMVNNSDTIGAQMHSKGNIATTDHAGDKAIDALIQRFDAKIIAAEH
jgi:DNA polymerase III subunit gamma/tau